MQRHSNNTPRLRVGLWTLSEVHRRMNHEYARILQETAISAACLFLVYESVHLGFPIVASILAMVVGLINTLTASEFYRVLREVQAEKREDYTESEE